MYSESSNNNRPVLSPGYYLDNFMTLIDYVKSHYKDLLHPEELAFTDDFKSLDQDARRLYVRLITRKGPCFRKDKIVYREIDNLEESLTELRNRNFILLNPREDLEAALHTITKPELAGMVSRSDRIELPDEIVYGGKQSVVLRLLEFDDRQIWDELEKEWNFIYPQHGRIIFLFFLLFFGNTDQSLSDFILEEIGVLRYEPYTIRKEDRLFNDREVIDGFMFISEIRTKLLIAMEDNDVEMVTWLGTLLKESAPADSIKRKFERIFTGIGRFLEKFGMYEEAIGYYKLSSVPPARERMIRVLDKIGRTEEALSCIEGIIGCPADDEEEEFGRTFREKLKRKLGRPYTRITREKFVTEIIPLEPVPGKKIEEIVLDYFTGIGTEGFYTENGIWTALFGLVFWNVIFMPVPEVFFNPFQRGPTDLFGPEFKERREAAIVSCMEELDHDPEWKTGILDRYDEKFNTANLLVPWKRVGREQVIQIMEWIPRKHILEILQRMTGRLKDFRSGFPDLVVFDPPSGQYKLVEVKGPGDQLRPNQKRWIRFFSEKGIPYTIIRVKWKD
ncbi:MAG: VRR-NUC domain-containing protein [Bacteroidales bacterium]|nr:MAG: VRR-NUC domain-containing protein [Bacteroidales bacterium]